jgi:hypothetical protein
MGDGQLVSVDVDLPRDVTWGGVKLSMRLCGSGECLARRMVRRLNVEGDLGRAARPGWATSLRHRLRFKSYRD